MSPQDRPKPPKRGDVPIPDRLTVLRASEVLLQTALVGADPQHVAALARELRATVREIAEVQAVTPAGVSLSDELEAKRARRVASAADPAPAVRRGQPRRSGGQHQSG